MPDVGSTNKTNGKTNLNGPTGNGNGPSSNPVGSCIYVVVFLLLFNMVNIPSTSLKPVVSLVLVLVFF